MEMQDPLEIEKIVSNHMWKSVLLSLIYEKKIDPWDVDLDSLVDGFIAKVREMKELDLVIPGNLILATSILLKYKSLTLIEEEQDSQQAELLETGELPKISLIRRIEPARPITVNELITAIESSIRVEIEKIRAKKPRKEQVLFYDVKEGDDIYVLMENTFKKIVENMDEYGTATFSSVVKNIPDEQRMRMFLLVLHLELEGFLNTRQDAPFEELLLCVNKNKVIANA